MGWLHSPCPFWRGRDWSLRHGPMPGSVPGNPSWPQRMSHRAPSRNVGRNLAHERFRYAFSTWTPKAVATIRGLAVTLEDRAVTLMLQRKPPGIKVERLRRRDNKEFAD